MRAQSINAPCPDPGDGIKGRPKNCTDPPQALLSDPTQLIGFSAVSVFWPHGHEKPRITYGLYSGGASLEVKRAAVE